MSKFGTPKVSILTNPPYPHNHDDKDDRFHHLLINDDDALRMFGFKLLLCYEKPQRGREKRTGAWMIVKWFHRFVDGAAVDGGGRVDVETTEGGGDGDGVDDTLALGYRWNEDDALLLFLIAMKTLFPQYRDYGSSKSTTRQDDPNPPPPTPNHRIPWRRPATHPLRPALPLSQVLTQSSTVPGVSAVDPACDWNHLRRRTSAGHRPPLRPGRWEGDGRGIPMLSPANKYGALMGLGGVMEGMAWMAWQVASNVV